MSLLPAQLSLYGRMIVAYALLAIVSTVVVATAVLVAGFVGWVALLTAVGVLEATVFPVFGWETGLTWQLLEYPFTVIGSLGVVLLPVLYLGPVWERTRQFRRDLRTAGTPAPDRDPAVADMAQKLAQQANIPAPEVRIANRSRPTSYALSGPDGGTIVLSRGLVRAVTDEQLRAVIAHEISHLANGDSRLMDIAVLPVLIAETVGSDDRPQWIRHGITLVLLYLVHVALWAVLRVVTTIQYLGCQIGVAYFSRGRESAADRAAAKLTGSPGALAGALRTLDDERGSPGPDARELPESPGALDILPQSDETTGLFRTHPRTEPRIDRLQTLETQMRDEN